MSSSVSNDRHEVIVEVESDRAAPPPHEGTQLIGIAQETCWGVQQIAKVLFCSLVAWATSYWIAKAIIDDPGSVIGFSIMGGCAGGLLAIKYWIKK
ncbi:hypothetical protein LCGC14_2623280 [marine sediment metagenome]|uniref:Uncharacterized protein n=1 Tax=marine sediment metagenome TaxID=412755 RepID=A0A0F9AQ49_9ZZZZ|nr:hypothetical protein [Candidatus Anoxychlamydiales bacterium]